MHLFEIISLAAISLVSLASCYVLNPDDVYQGNTFFEKFDFLTVCPKVCSVKNIHRLNKSQIPDPNVGFVQYIDQNEATNSRLVSVNQAQQVYIGVDYENIYDVNSPGRKSIRLESKKTYQYGLFVFDLAHMPANTCGKWSAFWTTNKQDWPRWGEIDIIENINEYNNSLEALHTGANCVLAGNQMGNEMAGKMLTYNCDRSATSSPYGTQATDQGCSAENLNQNNYGTEFNNAGGGIYAMEWQNEAINIWQFNRQNIPQDLSSKTPNPNAWGTPVFTTKQGSCNIDDHFKDHKIVIDSAFCGNWAGQDALWQQTSCYKSDPAKYKTCQSYVGSNPAAYKESYWLVNSLTVYQKQANNSGNAPSNLSPGSGPPENSPTITSSVPEIMTEVPLASTGFVGTRETASASGIPYPNSNYSQPNYRPTATASGISQIASVFVTQTIVPIGGDSGSNDAGFEPVPKFETAGGSKAIRVDGSSVLALISALAMAVAF